MVLILVFVEICGCLVMIDIVFFIIVLFLYFVNDYVWYLKYFEIDKKVFKIYIVDFLIVYNKWYFLVFFVVVFFVVML